MTTHKPFTAAQKPLTIVNDDEGNIFAKANPNHRAGASVVAGDPDACRAFTAYVFGEGAITMYTCGMQDLSVDVLLVLSMTDNPMKTWQRRYYSPRHRTGNQPRMMDMVEEVEQVIAEWLN